MLLFMSQSMLFLKSKKMTVTFCGHSEIHQKEHFSAWLDALLPSLIAGGQLNFTSAATEPSTVWPRRQCGDKRKPIPTLK